MIQSPKERYDNGQQNQNDDHHLLEVTSIRQYQRLYDIWIAHINLGLIGSIAIKIDTFLHISNELVRRRCDEIAQIGVPMLFPFFVYKRENYYL